MNLFWKILLSFGLAIALTLIGAVIVSTRLAETSFEQGNIQGRELVQQARQALDDGGRQGLVAWLKNNDRPSSLLVMYVLDQHAEELLGRTVDERFREDALSSEESFRRLERRQEEERIRESLREGGPREDDFDRSRLWFRFSGYPYRLFGDEGERFYYQIRAQRELFGIFNWPSAQISLLVIAAAAAALMALAMARYISRPIVRLQKASRALAAGALETRVGGASTKRSDEVGILARDFDAMAERIQGLVVAKETLLRDISHELRSPLARIRVALALAERHMNDLGRNDFERIEQETERLDALVGQIMTLTRLRTQPDVRHAPVDLGACIDGIAENAHYEYPDVELEWSRTDVPAVHGDETELRSAIENVVRNALSFSGEGGRVSITLSAGADGVSITVADTGPGVADAQLEQIFEPFYRTDQSRNHERRGEGIGLAITASVMERHGGRVIARNRRPRGLEIDMWIPYGSRTGAATRTPS